jgi:hypothetical protein
MILPIGKLARSNRKENMDELLQDDPDVKEPSNVE